MQSKGKLGTLQPGTNQQTGMVMSGGVAKMNRPLTPGEIQRGFTGKVTSDGRALIKFQNRVFTVPASRVSGLSARLAMSQNQQRVAQWTAQQKTGISQRIKALANVVPNTSQKASLPFDRSGNGSGCIPPDSVKCQFNKESTRPGSVQVTYAPAIQKRIDLARQAKIGNSSTNKYDEKIVWGPHSDKVGPLGNPNDQSSIASTFRSGTYTERVTEQDTTLYRVHGGQAAAMGRYWTTIKPSGPLQAIQDSALKPEWKNSADKVSVIRVPKGTKIFEGYAAPQTSEVGTRAELTGGGPQIYIKEIDQKWAVSNE
jgi:hypothetical protein